MADVVRLKITLKDVEPQVLRRIEVPIDIWLDDLHLVFQYAMGWENGHLFEFRAGRTAWGILDPDDSWGDGPLAAEKATLGDLLANAAGKKKTFQYIYDFGDNWEHKVAVEAITPAAEGMLYPRLIEAIGACPPEDIGGPWGYGDYLEAITDPSHERHDQMIEWGGPDFDPSAVDADAIDRKLALLADIPVPPKAKPKKKSRSSSAAAATGRGNKS